MKRNEMPCTAERVRRLEKILDRAVQDYPHSRNIVAAFRPLIIEKAVLMETLDLEGGMTAGFDEQLFNSGVPLLLQNEFTPSGDVCDLVALSMLPAIAQGFPHLSSDMDKIAEAVREKRITLSDCLTPATDEDRNLIDKWSRDEGVSAQSLALAVRAMGRVCLERTARIFSGLIRDFAWDRGCCPICSSPPMIARIREGSGIRLLNCSECCYEWPFSRVICPSCESRVQKNMSYFFVEDRRMEMAFVCEECRQYLITIDKVSDLTDFDAEIAALSLVHLDVIMQEKGYRPMADCEWNACTQVF